ncbi:MAG: hypothetical protein HDS88_04755 [Bacteroidales bacterium]|nr:hypothetical protein [Bacteroidales bacterium]
MEQPYTANTLIIKSVGMLPGASAEYTSLSINVQHKKRLHHLTQPPAKLFRLVQVIV